MNSVCGNISFYPVLLLWGCVPAKRLKSPVSISSSLNVPWCYRWGGCSSLCPSLLCEPKHHRKRQFLSLALLINRCLILLISSSATNHTDTMSWTKLTTSCFRLNIHSLVRYQFQVETARKVIIIELILGGGVVLQRLILSGGSYILPPASRMTLSPTTTLIIKKCGHDN